jgi:hypothetical protein
LAPPFFCQAPQPLFLHFAESSYTNLPSKVEQAFQPIQAQAEACGYQKMSFDHNMV